MAKSPASPWARLNSAGGRLGQARRYGWPRSEVEAARRDLAAAQIEVAITETLAAAPPLTDAQRVYLAALLTGEAKRNG